MCAHVLGAASFASAFMLTLTLQSLLECRHSSCLSLVDVLRGDTPTMLWFQNAGLAAPSVSHINCLTSSCLNYICCNAMTMGWLQTLLVTVSASIALCSADDISVGVEINVSESNPPPYWSLQSTVTLLRTSELIGTNTQKSFSSRTQLSSYDTAKSVSPSTTAHHSGARLHSRTKFHRNATHHSNTTPQSTRSTTIFSTIAPATTNATQTSRSVRPASVASITTPAVRPGSSLHPTALTDFHWTYTYDPLPTHMVQVGHAGAGFTPSHLHLPLGALLIFNVSTDYAVFQSTFKHPYQPPQKLFSSGTQKQQSSPQNSSYYVAYPVIDRISHTFFVKSELSALPDVHNRMFYLNTNHTNSTLTTIHSKSMHPTNRTYIPSASASSAHNGSLDEPRGSRTQTASYAAATTMVWQSSARHLYSDNLLQPWLITIFWAAVGSGHLYSLHRQTGALWDGTHG